MLVDSTPGSHKLGFRVINFVKLWILVSLVEKIYISNYITLTTFLLKFIALFLF